MTSHPRDEIRCPFCGSGEVELMSLFGQQLLTVQYYCAACRTPFERVKGEDTLADGANAIKQGKGPGGG